MTDAVTLRGEQLLVKVGNGATPEVFAHPCLINTTRGVQFTTQNNQVIIPDCDNPSDPAWTRAIKESMSMSINGSGTLHLPNVEEYFNWLKSPDSKNVQAVIGDPVATPVTGGYFSAAFDLTEFEINGERGNVAEVSISLASNGKVDWTAHT